MINKETVQEFFKDQKEYLLVASNKDDILTACGEYNDGFIFEVLAFIVNQHPELFMEFVLMEAVKKIATGKDKSTTIQ